MKVGRRAMPLLFVLASCPHGLPAQEPAARHPQRLCFVGDPEAARTAGFLTFLRQRFAAVDLFDRQESDPSRLQQADVVLLDWPQSGEARAHRQQGWSPLGPRSDWRTPTILLGSAGLNLAGSWQVRGGFG